MEIKELVENFLPINLSEIDKVKLMNRIDTKYVLSYSVLEKVLKAIEKDYFILEMKNKRQFPYQSLYYDTINNDMYKAHHNGKLNRYKIRFRKYVSSDDTFLEIKEKVKGIRTLKNRIEVNSLKQTLCNSSKDFIKHHTSFDPEHLESKIYTNFSRITLVGKKMNERVTIDTNLHFQCLKDAHYKLENSSIIELKRDGEKKYSRLKEVLNHIGVHPSGMSKYCLGRALTEENIKKNTFKSKILNINKIENGKFYYRDINLSQL